MVATACRDHGWAGLRGRDAVGMASEVATPFEEAHPEFLGGSLHRTLGEIARLSSRPSQRKRGVALADCRGQRLLPTAANLTVLWGMRSG
jgi:hypothetical protein